MSTPIEGAMDRLRLTIDRLVSENPEAAKAMQRVLLTPENISQWLKYEYQTHSQESAASEADVQAWADAIASQIGEAIDALVRDIEKILNSDEYEFDEDAADALAEAIRAMSPENIIRKLGSTPPE